MIKSLIAAALFIVVVIFGLSTYLQPDDLSGCGEALGSGTNCQSVDAIVAVSGGDTYARASEAIKMYKNGWSKVLIFSGAAQDKTGPSNAAAMKQIALQAGVPDSAISLDEYSETTEQNAKNTQTIFAQQGIKKVVLVTSGYHQRRAGLEFSKRASGVTILNHPVHSDKDWSFWWWITPYGWWLAIGELVKIIVFYVTGTWA